MIKTIIFDWKRTLYNPETKRLEKGAKEILDFSKANNISLYLVGKGKEDMQEETKRLGVENYFTRLIFVEQKNLELFKPFVSKNTKETLTIGDRTRSELEIGNHLGTTTIWIKQGKFSEELPENKYQQPDFTVTSLVECLDLLKSFLQE